MKYESLLKDNEQQCYRQEERNKEANELGRQSCIYEEWGRMKKKWKVAAAVDDMEKKRMKKNVKKKKQIEEKLLGGKMQKDSNIKVEETGKENVVVEKEKHGRIVRWVKACLGEGMEVVSYIGAGVSNDLAPPWGLDPQFRLEHS